MPALTWFIEMVGSGASLRRHIETKLARQLTCSTHTKPNNQSPSWSLNMKPKGIAILGSTGSIGCNTLRVVEALGGEQFRIVALGAGNNVEILADQVARHLPELVSVATEAAAHDLRARLFERNIDLP